MIVRSWTARATADGARAYVLFFERSLVPQLSKIDGHRGALVLTHPREQEVDVTVLTFWDSEAAVARFAGDAPERAVVEPEARALLLAFDDRVTHHRVMLDTFHR